MHPGATLWDVAATFRPASTMAPCSEEASWVRTVLPKLAGMTLRNAYRLGTEWTRRARGGRDAEEVCRDCEEHRNPARTR